MTSYDLVTEVREADTGELWPVYDAVFGDLPGLESWRQAVWDGHVARDGFRLARAYDGPTLVGFAYGYTGQHGQWWTDQAATVLDAAVALEWLGGHFELVSIGVLPSARGRGVGAALLAEITRDLPQARWLLMTSDGPHDPARRLYESQGWAVVGPGVEGGQVILGRRRPSRDSAPVDGPPPTGSGPIDGGDSP